MQCSEQCGRVCAGVRSARLAALAEARAAGLALALRTAREAARLAGRLERAPAGEVAVVGGGALACELAAALAHACEPPRSYQTCIGHIM